MDDNIKKELNDNEVFMIAQFIDILDILDKYNKLEDIKLDIKNRKKVYLKYLENMEKVKVFYL